MMNERDILRRCRFSPYRKGCGPTFHLILWDTHRQGKEFGKSILGYELREGSEVLFTGEDFYCSPFCAIDSDKAVRSLMTFLTLRPEDTDAGYFEEYTERQLEYCDEHAETLSWYTECCWHGGSLEYR